MDVKQALLDPRFRDKLPEIFLGDIQKFLNNPNCGCNHPIYRRVVKEAHQQLQEYFPLLEPSNIEEEIDKLATNDWTVINCNITELEKQLKGLPIGRKQLEIARWQDQVTVVINNLDIVF
jgi:hypothetical protein